VKMVRIPQADEVNCKDYDLIQAALQCRDPKLA